MGAGFAIAPLLTVSIIRAASKTTASPQIAHFLSEQEAYIFNCSSSYDLRLYNSKPRNCKLIYTVHHHHHHQNTTQTSHLMAIVRAHVNETSNNNNMN